MIQIAWPKINMILCAMCDPFIFRSRTAVYTLTSGSSLARLQDIGVPQIVCRAMILLAIWKMPPSLSATHTRNAPRMQMYDIGNLSGMQ